MKKIALTIPCSLLLLSACSGSRVSEGLAERLKNPLYAERYYDSMTDHMVNIIVQDDPLAKDPAMADIIEKARLESLRRAKEATTKQHEGLQGTIISDFSYAIGEALLLNGTLYLSADFETLPGPELHAYVSTALDPREPEASFPDASAIDLGIIKTAYGAHSYEVPADAQGLRSFVLYDVKLRRIYGFAQLQPR